MTTRLTVVAAMLATTLCCSSVCAADVPVDLPAQVARVQSLTQAGRLDDAEALLKGLEVPASVHARLLGVIALERRDYAQAAEQFVQARAAESEQGKPGDPRLSLYLAHAYVRLQQYDKAIAAAADSRSLAESLVAQPLVMAHALRGAGRTADAFDVLRRAVVHFPQEHEARLELIALASEQSVRQVAREQAAELLRLDIDRETGLALIHALHEDPLATALLERVAARFQSDAEVKAHLAHAYVAQGDWYAAGLIFEQAVLLGGDYVFEAADQYRLAGATQRALAMNSRMADPGKRVRQRLSILFAAGEMARVVALEPELRRHGVDDDVTRYRLAWAHFALHQTEKAARLARGLLTTGYESQAKALLSAMGRSPK